MQVFRFRIFHAIGIALLMVACLAASPRDAAAQDATSFIQSLGTRGLQALSPSLPPAQQEARFKQLLDGNALEVCPAAIRQRSRVLQEWPPTGAPCPAIARSDSAVAAHDSHPP